MISCALGVLLFLYMISASTIVVPDPREESNIDKMQYDKAKSLLDTSQLDEITEKLIDLNTYEYKLIPQHKPDYTIGLLIDPCKTLNPGCCQDRFGSPTHIVPGSDLNVKGVVMLVDEFSNPVDEKLSRLGDIPSVFDARCLTDSEGKPYLNDTIYHPNGLITFSIDYSSLCVGHHYSAVAVTDRALPPCWDNNQTVTALNSCYTFDGHMKPNCIAIGYTQTTSIVQCLGEFALDNHCGTFLELHKPGDETILAQTRLFGEFTNGYRTTTMPLFHRGNRSRTICNGEYEIWWVLRTRYKFVVKFQKKFYIETPLCEFDPVANKYRGFATLSP